MSKFLISEVPTLWNLRTGPTERLKDNSDVPEAKLGILPNIFTSSKKNKAAFYFPAEEWALPAVSTKEPEERVFVVDSGASMHMVSKKDLHSAELETMRTSRSPTTVANGEVQTREDATENFKQLTYLSMFCFLKKLPQFFPWRNSVRIVGIHTTGSAVKNTSHHKWQEKWLQFSNYVPFAVFLNYTFTDFSIIFIEGFRIWCQQIHRKSSTGKKWKYEWRASERPATGFHRNRKQK